MEHFGIPHDEAHRFLRWGPIDDEFNSWCRFFDEKDIQYEIGGAKSRGKDGREIERWTVYKHMLYTQVDAIECTRCCPQKGEL